MTGTTPPFHALEFLTGGRLDRESGCFRTPQGDLKYYRATDNLKSPAYRGLLPEDLFQIASRAGISFRLATQTGVPHVHPDDHCRQDSPEEAEETYEKVVELLDSQTEGEAHGVELSFFDQYLSME